jgi:hypothetical protein
MSLTTWGSHPEEIAAPVVGDHLCPASGISATRCITLSAPPDGVFPWIRQMGFKRAGWYSYDWIDNLGKKSATRIHPEWQDIHSGSKVPGGPIDFTAAIVEAPHTFVLLIQPTGKMGQRFCFTLAYELRDHPQGTRLVTRMRASVKFPGGKFAERLLAFGDGLMVRKQLLNLKKRTTAN